MPEILLRRDTGHKATSVPNAFIDDYMVHANGEFVKIYLYLLRCMNYPDTPFSIAATADKFEQPESDVRRALKYWEKLNLLRLEFNSEDEMTGICLLDLNSETNTPDKDAGTATPQERPVFSKNQIADLSSDTTVQETFFVAESFLGHPLNSTEIQDILYWLEELHLSQELIEYLIGSCVDNGHKSIHYMDKIALAWAKEGIKDPSQAKQSQEAHSSLSRSVQRAFGINGRSLAESELACVKRWARDYHFSDEIIACACERTINRIHQVNFEYAGSILASWHKQHVCTLKDIELLDAQYKEAKKNQAYRSQTSHTATGTTINRFTDIGQRTYDYDALERSLLTRS